MRIALALLLATGCGTSPADDSETGPVGTPENPVPSKEGPYAVRNNVDFTIEAVLPKPAEVVVATLREFSTNPAGALVAAADAAGVPALSALYGAIPGPLRDRFEGWINDFVDGVKINGKPITAYAGDMAMLAEFALSEFAVTSELDLRSGTANHRLTGVDLNPAGIDIVLPIGGLAGDILTQDPNVQVSEGGFVHVGEQHFGLMYGEYAWQGIEAASTQLFGQGVRATLGKAVNCTALAANIADKCVLGVCVGHQGLIEDICEGGLDTIVNLAHDAMAANKIEALHLISGTVRLVDDDGDGVGDRLVDGVWDAEMNLGLGLRHTPATFEGSR
ncbi:MAG: hypothetical protein H0V17_25545 [Deltaproteobacteria bacterium]|nr:hypothetical protein [Deltaproteobacteria bacterium]